MPERVRELVAVGEQRVDGRLVLGKLADHLKTENSGEKRPEERKKAQIEFFYVHHREKLCGNVI